MRAMLLTSKKMPKTQIGLTTRHINKIRCISTSTARIMLPDDSNPAGNVHGGVILKMIEENGILSAHKYLANTRDIWQINGNRHPSVALARIDRVDFDNPMHIGELAQLESAVTYAGGKSIEVQVNVFSEDLYSGVKKQTNKARLWYVVADEECIGAGWKDSPSSMPPKLPLSPITVPHLKYSSKIFEAEATARYEAQKNSRNPEGKKLEAVSNIRRPGVDKVLAHVALSSDCFRSGYVYGGVIMKLMDTAAGVTAVRYCKTNCVTASVEALNMVSPVFLGNVINVYAHPTFTSSRTLEIAVYVEAEDILTGNSWRAVSAHLTFVSLDTKGKILPIPQLNPTTHEGRMDFAQGEERYKIRKQLREKGKKD